MRFKTIRKCLKCKDDYVITGGGSKYCSVCSPIMQQENRKKYQKKYWHNHYYPYVEKKRRKK